MSLGNHESVTERPINKLPFSFGEPVTQQQKEVNDSMNQKLNDQLEESLRTHSESTIGLHKLSTN